MPKEFQSSKERSRYRTHLLLGSVAIVGAIFVAVRMFGGYQEGGVNAPLAQLTRKTGEILISRKTGSVKYQPDLHVFPGDYLRTKSNSTLTVKYIHDDTTLELQPQTKVQIYSIKGGKQILIKNGSVHFSVPEQPGKKPLKCMTPNTEATVLQPGDFTVSFEDLRSTFGLRDGKLQIRNTASGTSKIIQGETTHVCKPEGSGKIEFGEIDTSFEQH